MPLHTMLIVNDTDWDPHLYFTVEDPQFLPNVGEFVVWEGKRYQVIERVFPFSSPADDYQRIDLTVKKVRG